MDSENNGGNSNPNRQRQIQRRRGGGGRKPQQQQAKSNSDKNKNQTNHNRGKNRNNDGRNQNSSTEASSTKYPPYQPLEECLRRYNLKEPNIIRGKLRVLTSRNAMSFCTCDRGSQRKDVLVETELERNRALDGDTVYVELYDDNGEKQQHRNEKEEENSEMQNLDTKPAAAAAAAAIPANELAAETQTDDNESYWQDDPIQMKLWAPAVMMRMSGNNSEPLDSQVASATSRSDTGDGKTTNSLDEDVNNSSEQRKGRVIYVEPPKSWASEIKQPKTNTKAPSPTCRNIVGTLKRLKSGTALLVPNNKSLPQFKCSISELPKPASDKANADDGLFTAKYVYESWKEDFKWPPCIELTQLGVACNVEAETYSLLTEFDVNHGEFPLAVLDECQKVVASGEYHTENAEGGWRPTQEMYQGRRDYRHKRIFTIDPTSAKDLDDALHIELLEGGKQVEIGVHIADVSYFVTPDSTIDMEARRRCTTVYLVDRTIPMLPRPLCEIACSLNENVERLAFSCVWRMNVDGTMLKGDGHIWYGRTVIKSCARLDYSTAQNIIDEKVCIDGEDATDEDLWPLSRRPTAGHTLAQVAADVRLMNRVAISRRQLRFQHGALALNAVKLTFQLDADRETPLICQQYEIKDSNRLVEEYMLLANYLVAQRLILKAGGLALLRHHEEPLKLGLEKVAEVAKAALGIAIDFQSAERLQKSLNRIARTCNDDIALQCITEMLKIPLKPANYIAAGDMQEERWRHFALNIPYYTHFTSPIRRYADVMVHRLLQATLDGEEAIENFPYLRQEIGEICGRCNEKKDSSRKAQERSDVVFLALYLRKFPLSGQLGIVLSVGLKAFTVFVPALGVSAMVFLLEHEDWIEATPYEVRQQQRIKLKRIKPYKSETWKDLDVKVLSKFRVRCLCRDRPPISVQLKLEGPWIAQ